MEDAKEYNDRSLSELIRFLREFFISHPGTSKDVLADATASLAAYSELNGKVKQYKVEILKVATISNINIRGNSIEQLITQAVNTHTLQDLSYSLEIGIVLMVDIKTKMLSLSSNPICINRTVSISSHKPSKGY